MVRGWFLLHATEVWVAQLGVPVKFDLWMKENAADSTAGLHRATNSIPLADIRPFVVDVGINGELSNSGEYWTTDADLRRLFNDEIPDRTESWSKKRVLLYLHGGLNDESSVARRIIAFRNVCLENEIYPVHIMWESGLFESLNNIIRDIFTRTDERSVATASWLDRFREGLVEARDCTLELTAALPGTAVWREMKENARLSSQHPDNKGGMQLLVEAAISVLENLPQETRNKWELHVVGHSAGCIYSAFGLPHLSKVRVNFKSLQFMAPAITVELFKSRMLPAIKANKCPHPTVLPVK